MRRKKRTFGAMSRGTNVQPALLTPRRPWRTAGQDSPLTFVSNSGESLSQLASFGDAQFTRQSGAAARKAVLKLLASSALLMGTIVVWIIDRDGPLGAVASVFAIVIAVPMVLLVAIDTGKAFSVGGCPVASSRTPELALGALAYLGSAGGFLLLFVGNLKFPFFISGSFISGVLLLLGARWIRNGWRAARP